MAGTAKSNATYIKRNHPLLKSGTLGRNKILSRKSCILEQWNFFHKSESHLKKRELSGYLFIS